MNFTVHILTLGFILADKDDIKKRALDAMYKLEHGVTDKTSQKKALPGLSDIEDIQSVWKEDYLVNKALRESFRVSSQISGMVVYPCFKDTCRCDKMNLFIQCKVVCFVIAKIFQ